VIFVVKTPGGRSCGFSPQSSRFHWCHSVRPGQQERAGIVNFSKVDVVVACGGATDTAASTVKADGFKAIINLRTAGEQGANLEQNAARAKELGLKYISIPSVQQPDPKAGHVPRRDRQQGKPACVRPLRIGQPSRFVLARQTRVTRRLDGREGHRRAKDWPSR
jgi:hypothetical protein